MADLKISQLTSATTPLTGTEVLPIVQSGSTVKVAISDVTAGRAISASGVTISGGTINGVAYLNASRVVTTGTGLTFDGTNLGLAFGAAKRVAVVFSNDYRNGVIFDGDNRTTQVFATTAAGDAGGAIIFSTRQGAGSSATDYGTERGRISATGNFVAGGSVALATNATDGFLYVPTCAGTPTGTPTAITGMAPIVVNTTNNKLYFYSGGAWRDAGP